MPGVIGSRSISVLAASLLFFCVSCPADAKIRFDIPAQPLAMSLAAVGNLANINVLFDQKLVDDLQAPPLKAELSPDEAITQLIVGTRLRIVRVNERTLTIVADTNAESVQESFSVHAHETALSAHAGAFESPSNDNQVENAPVAQGGGESPQLTRRSDDNILDEIVITGSHIRGGDFPTGSPMLVLNEEEIQKSGYSSVRDLLRSVPQNFGGGFDGFSAALTPATGQNVDYSTAINLRGLGPGSTLTLLNGHRLVASGISNAVDISVIPLSVVSRVDILTDGASAVYGSDAIAGVVNFVLKERMEGAETRAEIGGTSGGGATTREISQTLGTAWQTGSALIAYEHYDRDPIQARQRDFSSDVPGPTDLRIGEKRNSVFLHAKQNFDSNVSTYIDALYSADKIDNVNSAQGFLFHDQVHKAVASINGGIDFILGDNWHILAAGNFGDDNDAQRTNYPPAPDVFNTGYRNRVASGSIQLDGRLFHLPGGDAAFSIGADSRFERFTSNLDQPPDAFDRTVYSGFAELNLPVLSADSAVGKVSVAIAGRLEHYNDFGSAKDPKIGISWQPIRGWTVRSSWGKAFQAPTLYQLHSPTLAALFGVADPQSPSGSSVALLNNGSNPSLKPQTAQTWTIGLDWKPISVPGFAISVTYFTTKFRDRIQQVETSFDSYLANEAFDSAYIIRNPTPEFVQSKFYGASQQYLGAYSLSDVTVYLDNADQNVATSKVSGLDFTCRVLQSLPVGHLAYAVNVAYLLQNESQNTPLAPSRSQLDKLFQPNSLKILGTVGYNLGPIDSTLALNYVSRYKNDTVVPTVDIASFFTANIQISLDMEKLRPATLLKNTRLSLNVLNIFDRSPPFVSSPQFYGAAPFGYDPSNANPEGRFISAQVVKGW